MADSAIDFQGLDTIVGVLRNAAPNGTRAMAGIMFEVMSDVFDETQREVPVRTGVLKASGHLDKHKPPTKAKYVEDPMKTIPEKLSGAVQKSDFEAAILRQYPQSPARAHQADMTASTNAGYHGMSAARRRQATAHSKAMTSDDIGAMLARASARPGQMIRKR